jgi:ABC-2 type transport system permease protein
MDKFWLISRHAYLRQVRTKRFIFGLLSMPLFVLLMIGIGTIAVRLQLKSEPIGYVDHSGFLANPVSLPDQGSFFNPNLIIFPYSDETSADADLQTKKIQALYVISSDYLQTGIVERLVLDRPGGNADAQFIEFLRLNLMRNQPGDIANRVLNGSSITTRSLDGSRSVGGDSFLAFILPFAAGLMFILVISFSGSYLLQAVVEEKENRTMEILITSVSPEQLMAGKTIANLLAGLTQLVAWLGFGLLALAAAQLIFHFGGAETINLGQVGLLLLILIPAFVMVAALMTAAGATVTEAREAQQISGFFILPMVAPYWFMTAIMSNPNGPLAVILSIFPLTSPVTLPLRIFFTIVPVWQVILSVGVLIASAIGALWLAGKIFRMGMLRYGKSLSLREIFSGKSNEGGILR